MREFEPKVCNSLCKAVKQTHDRSKVRTALLANRGHVRSENRLNIALSVQSNAITEKYRCQSLIQSQKKSLGVDIPQAKSR